MKSHRQHRAQCSVRSVATVVAMAWSVCVWGALMCCTVCTESKQRAWTTHRNGQTMDQKVSSSITGWFRLRTCRHHTAIISQRAVVESRDLDRCSDRDGTLRAIGPINQSINHVFFRVVQVIKSLQDPLEVGNNLPGIDDTGS